MHPSPSGSAGRSRLGCLLAVVFLATGCASAGQGAQEGAWDPLEPINRPVYKFNDTFDTYLLRPVAKTYDTVAPKPVKFAVMNFFYNLETPIYIVNHLLQGKPGGAARQTGRLVINTVLGLGGIIDAAKDAGLPRDEEDFGQTLAVWGMGPGPYLVIPFLGPSNPRDGTGLVADSYLHPLRYYDNTEVQYGLIALRVIEARRQLLSADSAVDQAPDPYVFVREAYMQNRRYKVHDGKPPLEDLDDFEAEFEADFED